MPLSQRLKKNPTTRSEIVFVSAVPFHYIDLQAFCYATEDDKRVLDALQAILPADTTVERSESEGHHGDRIIVFASRLERADDIRYVLSKLSQIEDPDRLRQELEQRIDDECAFYLQLDKQEAYQGNIRLGTGLLVRGKIEAYPAKREIALSVVNEFIDELFSEPTSS